MTAITSFYTVVTELLGGIINANTVVGNIFKVFLNMKTIFSLSKANILLNL